MPRFWLIMLSLVASACADAVGPEAPSPLPGPGPSPTSIFDPAALHDVQVVMSAADWQDLRDFFRDNQYYAANATLDGQPIQQIGVRSRGQGSRSGTKPALKLDFNQYVKGQRFQGQKSIAVKNLIQDVSMLRDTLAMSVFEAMGIPAPRYSFTRLTVNGEYFGVYNIVESVEEPFLDARFRESTGNLYNYDYGIGIDAIDYDFGDRGREPSAYIPLPFQPETNQANLDPSALIDFIRTANRAPDTTFLADVGRYTDVDRVLTYVAVENALAEQDGFVGNFGMNNFYLYQYAGTTRFFLIPWDKNTSFASAQWPLLFNLNTNVLIRRITANPAKLQFYRSEVARAAGFVNSRFLGPKLDQAYALIRDAALADTKKPDTNATFEEGVRGLKGLIAAREGDILAQTR